MKTGDARIAGPVRPECADGGSDSPPARRREPLISVILAVRDAASTVGRTLDSILAQTYPAVELVVVDGGSSDGTLDAIGRLGDRVAQLITGPDEGVYDAYNKGIAVAGGDWLYFIGAGDTLAHDSVFVDLLTPEPRGKLVYGNVRWGSTGKVYDGRFSRLKLCRRNICHQAVLYNRELFALLGGYDTRYPLVADWDFNLRCFGSRSSDPEYRDIVVARFELGGLSGSGDDHPFAADRDRIIARSLGRRWLLLHRTYRLQRDFVRSIVERLKAAVR